MSTSRNLTRQRLIQAAIDLFATQGVTETTTKQIAELAAVNEVTLFRQFGNKHGLLLAVIEDAQVFTQLGQSLVGDLPTGNSLPQMLRDYADTCLQALAQTPAVVRSLVGESGQYSPENRQALGKGLDRANRKVAQYLKTAIGESAPELQISIEQLAGLLNTLLFGYAAIELTSEFQGLWRDRSDFLDKVVMLFLAGAVAQPELNLQIPIAINDPDLPAPLVQQILQKSKQHSPQTYAIIYVLCGSGLSADELVRLTRSDYTSSSDRQSIHITTGSIRQVPINQWIMGKRYGSYSKNPLTQWLKSRKDTHPNLFLSADGGPLTVVNLEQQWAQLTSEFTTIPTLTQVRSTWCIEMLMRGLSIETMQMLTGWNATQLAPYLRHAQEQLALAQAFNLDKG